MNTHSPYVPRKIDLVFEVVHGPRQAFAGLHGVQKSHALCLCSQRIRIIGFVRELRKHCKKRCEFLFFGYFITVTQLQRRNL